MPAGVEVRAEVGVGLPGLEDLVGDLEQGVRDRDDRLLLGDREKPWEFPGLEIVL